MNDNVQLACLGKCAIFSDMNFNDCKKIGCRHIVEIGWNDAKASPPKNSREVIVGYFTHRNPNFMNPKRIVTTARFSGGKWRFLKKSQKTMKSSRVMVWMDFPSFDKKPAQNQQRQPSDSVPLS